MQTPTILVLCGATGDLVAKKILPALWNLFSKGRLPPSIAIVAFGRKDLTTEDFQRYVSDILGAERSSPDFLSTFSYHQGQFDHAEDYTALAAHLQNRAAAWNDPVGYAYYLAVPPELTTMICNGLHTAGLAQEPSRDAFRRVIIEKPIGVSAATAETIEASLEQTWSESQIYRIDHYLGKEMVQNLLSFRFSNSLFEQSWNAQHIERIDIRLWESLGVETRGSFYDNLGALRDVGQNHLLQMLALVTMDHPEQFAADAIRAQRASILEALQIPSPDTIMRTTRRAQYDGYRTIPGVQPHSMTETYFNIETQLTTPRWSGVPIMLESGKRMGRPRKEIVVTFREPSHCPYKSDADEHRQNTITFGLEPTEGIFIDLWNKKAGLDFTVEKRTMDLLFREGEARPQYVEEYEKLFLDAILGDQTLFVDKREVNAMWRAIDPIIEAWHNNLVPLETYKPDTADIAEQARKTTTPRV